MKKIFKKIIVAILTYEARMLLRRAKPKIIAITGSVGKTSTKDAIYTAIKKKVRARKSVKSYNSEIGVPLSILGLPNAYNNAFKWLKNIFDGALTILIPERYPQWLVLEVGVDRPGDMEALTSWLRPDVVVLTRLPSTPVHVEFFDSPEAVTEEKKKLVEALKDDGIFVYNNDDENVRAIADDILQQGIGYSRYSPSQFTASADTVVYKNGVPIGVDFSLTHGDEVVPMHIRGSLGVQDVFSYAASAAVASIVGVPLQDVAESLKHHVPPPGRMRLVEGIKNTMIIDATYNSSPVALKRALQTLSEVDGGRKIAVLGDMLELGKYSTKEHEDAGVVAASTCDILMTLGVRSRSIAEGALESGMSEKKIFQYEQVERAGRELEDMLKEGDIVLIKGSQSLRMEKIVMEIMARPEDAETLLVRQDSFWEKK